MPYILRSKESWIIENPDFGDSWFPRSRAILGRKQIAVEEGRTRDWTDSNKRNLEFMVGQILEQTFGFYGQIQWEACSVSRNKLEKETRSRREQKGVCMSISVYGVSMCEWGYVNA